MSVLNWSRQKSEHNQDVQQIIPKFGLILTESCLYQITKDLQPSIKRKHEGIVYLLGRTDGRVSLAIRSFCPQAQTTSGSFDVSASAMVPCIQQAYKYGLQIVGQVHTHPKEAFHSQGDDEGAHIRYAGYSSLVIPDYGMHLPNLDGSACFVWQDDGGWFELEKCELILVPEANDGQE